MPTNTRQRGSTRAQARRRMAPPVTREGRRVMPVQRQAVTLPEYATTEQSQGDSPLPQPAGPGAGAASAALDERIPVPQTPLAVTRYAASGETLEDTPNLLTSADGRLGVGVTPETGMTLQVQGPMRLRNAFVDLLREAGNAAFLGSTYSNTLSLSAQFVGLRAGGTEALPTAVTNDMVLARIGGRGHDGTSIHTTLGGFLDVRAVETWSTTQRGTALIFATTLQGTTLQAERFRIDGRGNLTTAGPVAGTGMQAGLVLKSGSAPTASHPADAVQAWVADRAGVALKASLHLRTEDGTSHVFGDRVGIGTLTPAHALDVVGAINASDATGTRTNLGLGAADDVQHSRLGLGRATTTAARLVFATELTQKILLFGDANSARFGLSMASGALQVHSASSARVDIGAMANADGVTFTPWLTVVGSTGVVGVNTRAEASLGSGAIYHALSINGSTLHVGPSSVQERPMARLFSSWVSNVDATRTARLQVHAYDATAAREGLRIEADGAVARLGFYGATAVVRPTVPAAATDPATTMALANALRTALVTLGLCA